MTTIIKYPGIYDLTENKNTNLDIRSSNVTFNGNMNTIYGWVHIGNPYTKVQNIKINNLYIQPPKNIYSLTDEFCPICSGRICDPNDAIKSSEECLVYIHGNNIEFNGCKLYPNKELKNFATISHSIKSMINGLLIPDLSGKAICYVKTEEGPIYRDYLNDK